RQPGDEEAARGNDRGDFAELPEKLLLLVDGEVVGTPRSDATNLAQEPARLLADGGDARVVADFHLNGAAGVPAEAADHFADGNDDLVVEAYLAKGGAALGEDA